MKKTYEMPKLRLIALTSADVITASAMSVGDYGEDGGLSLGHSDFWGAD